MTNEEWQSVALHLADGYAMAYLGFARTGDKEYAEKALSALAYHLRSRPTPSGVQPADAKPGDAAIALLREARKLMADLENEFAVILCGSGNKTYEEATQLLDRIKEEPRSALARLDALLAQEQEPPAA